MQIALVFFVPFLFKPGLLSQRPIVCSILLFIWLNHLVHIGVGNLLELERRHDQLLVIQRASPPWFFLCPPVVETLDFSPRLPVKLVGVPIDILVWLFLLHEVNEQLERGMDKDLILVMPSVIQRVYLKNLNSCFAHLIT